MNVPLDSNVDKEEDVIVNAVNDHMIEDLPTSELITNTSIELLEIKKKLDITMKELCIKIKEAHKISSDMNEEYHKLENEIETFPSLHEFIKATVSDMKQIKSQIQFIHNIIDES